MENNKVMNDEELEQVAGGAMVRAVDTTTPAARAAAVDIDTLAHLDIFALDETVASNLIKALNVTKEEYTSMGLEERKNALRNLSLTNLYAFVFKSGHSMKEFI